MNAAFKANAVKIVSPSGEARNLGAGASFEATFPSVLNLDTGLQSLSTKRINTKFSKISSDFPSFSGFTHLGKALTLDTTQPVYLSNDGWYLWQPQGWGGRYILSRTSASGNDWWIGGNSNGLGTASQPREGVLHSGHWYYNYGELNAWDSAWRFYWGTFNNHALLDAEENRWSLSLGQGNNVQPGDRFMLDVAAYADLKNYLPRGVSAYLPADIVRPMAGVAVVKAFRADDELSADSVLQTGDRLQVSLPMSELTWVRMNEWQRVNNAEIGLNIGGVTRWAHLDKAASMTLGGNQIQGDGFVTPSLVFQYQISSGDQDSKGGIQVGAIENYQTRFADVAGNRLWTQDVDVREQANQFQVAATGSDLSQQAQYIQALIPSGKTYWPDSNSDTPAIEIFYHYLSKWPSYHEGGIDVPFALFPSMPIFEPWTASMKSLFVGIITELEKYVNIDFLETNNEANSNIALGAYQMQGDIGGYGYYPPSPAENLWGSVEGDFWLNSISDLNSPWIRYAMAHELGHTLGLKHPGNYNAGDDNGGGEPPFLDSEEDNSRMTVMSYRDGLAMSEKYPNDYMLYDIATLQYLYGAKSYQTGNSAISIAYPHSEDSLNVYDMIYDTGGVDTLSVSNAGDNPLVMNLNQGEFCSIGFYENFGICFGTVIENAIGGAGADELIGNQADNILTGGAGADKFVFGSEWGHDSITDFVQGVDVISFERDANVRFDLLQIQVEAGNTLISYAGNRLTLMGYSASLGMSDFVFV